MLMQKTKDMGFGRSAIILAVAGFICKVIGALYRIPLTNVLGAEGMGAYQAVFPLFTILLTVSSGGITQAVSALISGAEDRAREARGVLRAALGEVITLSVSVAIITFALAPALSSLQANPILESSYRILAPVVIFSGISAIIKGYYHSIGNITPTVISNLTEQIIKLCVGLSLSLYLVPKGLDFAVTGALLGTFFAEAGSLAFLTVRYFAGKDKPSKLPPLYPQHYDFLRVLRAVLPLSLGGLILPLSSLLDSFILVNILTATTGSPAIATAQYGILSGAVSTITNLPVVFTVALSITVIPAACSDKRGSAIKSKADLSVKLVSFVCIPFAILMLAVSRPVISLLYPALTPSEKSTASLLLAITSLGAPALGMTQIYSSILYSMGLGSRSSMNLLIPTALKCVLTPPAVYLFGIYGAGVVSVICYISSAVISGITLRRALGKGDGLFRSSVIFAFIACGLIIPLFILQNHLNTLILFALCALCMILYLCITIKSGAFTHSELMSLPFTKRLVRPRLKENK